MRECKGKTEKINDKKKILNKKLFTNCTNCGTLLAERDGDGGRREIFSWTI